MANNSITVEDSLALLSRDYDKSNDLINAIGQANTLVHKLTIICISLAKERNDGSLATKVPGRWLKFVFGKDNSNSFYDNIKDVLHKRADKQSLLDYYLLCYDDEQKKVRGINVVDTAEFKNGELEVIFTSGIKPYIWNLQNNYTKLSLAEAMSLKEVYSIKLYEILKAAYNYEEWIAKNKLHTYIPNNSYEIVYDLIEIQLRLNLIDAARDERITREISKVQPDYDKIRKYLAENVEKEKNREPDPKKRNYIQKYRDWSSFRTKVLNPGKKELEEKTSICFEAKPVRTGRGGLTTAVRFKIYKNLLHPELEEEKEKVIVEEQPEISEVEKYSLAFKVQTLLGTENFTMDNVLDILKDAGYVYEKVETAYNLMKKSKTTIDNPTGYMRSLIKGNATASEPIKPKEKKKSGFGNFPQNTYDFNELEDLLLDN